MAERDESRRMPMRPPARTVCFGEVLWDVMPDARHLGGAPLNVAVHLARMQQPTLMVSAVGADPDGDAILDRIAQFGLDARGVAVHATRPTGTVRVTLSAGLPSYTIIEDVAYDAIVLTAAVADFTAQPFTLVHGSLALRQAPNRAVLRQLREAAQFVVCDINLREPVLATEVYRPLISGCDLLKLNEEELAQLSQWYGLDGSLAALAEHFSLDTIVLTLGARGAAAFHMGELLDMSSRPVANVVDTVGCGDAFLAAMLRSLQAGRTLSEALAAGVELGAQVAQRGGATPEGLKYTLLGET